MTKEEINEIYPLIRYDHLLNDIGLENFEFLKQTALGESRRDVLIDAKIKDNIRYGRMC